jgi:hypothetical protein
MRSGSLIVRVLLLVVPATKVWGANGYVGVYQDSAGTQACASVPLYTGTNLYVIAKTAGPTANGITGAEFRVEVSNPAGWLFSYTPPPDAGLTLGNPLDTTADTSDTSGLNISFPSCRLPLSGRVNLGRISVFNAGGDSTRLVVKRHNRPSSAYYQCALFTLCDSAFSKACMSSSAEPPCSPLKTSGGAANTPSTDGNVFTAVLDSASVGASPGIPVGAAFMQMVALDGTYGTYPPWSPTKPHLAFRTVAGLFVLDATTTGSQPLQVFQGPVADYTWSPDGDWLLLVTASTEEARKGLASLVAVPETGGTAATVIDKADVGNFVWGTDGSIYYWEREAPRFRQLAPPATWAPTQGPPFGGRPVLVFAVNQTTRKIAPYYFHAGLQEKTRLLTSYSVPGAHVLRRDGFSDGRLLLSAFGRGEGGAGATLIVDSQGLVLSRLGASWGDERFTGTSVSSDESFVAGERVTDDGHGILAAELWIVAANNGWRLRVSNVTWGMNPQLSRVGSFVAYMAEEGTRVGALQFNY